MIESLYLKHFKCFNENIIPLSRLTVLSGPNSSGKSTIIQALSSLMQTAVEARYSSYLALNGQYVSMGTISDVINIHKKEINGFTLGLTINNEDVKWEFESDEGYLSGARIVRVSVNGNGEEYALTELAKTTLDCLTPIASAVSALVSKSLLNMSHLTADRQAGHEIHSFVDRKTNAVGDRRIDVGARGEAVITLLMTEGERLLAVEDPRVVAGNAPSIGAQTRAWMSYLFPGASVESIPVETSSFFRLRFQTNIADQFRRPESVGYGFSQVLPLVALGLAAGTSNTLLIENPEVHLHPAAQSRLGRFIAKVVSSGVQIILETHSDHILNGIRLEIAEQEGLSSEVVLYSVSPDAETPGETMLEEILIDQDGRMTNWPKGFFDQAAEDAKAIALRKYGHD